jgi:hypothetical protein
MIVGRGTPAAIWTTNGARQAVSIVSHRDAGNGGGAESPEEVSGQYKKMKVRLEGGG